MCESNWILRLFENHRGKADIKYVVFAVLMLVLMVWMSYLVWFFEINQAIKLLSAAGTYTASLIGIFKYDENKDKKIDLEREKIKSEVKEEVKEESTDAKSNDK